MKKLIFTLFLIFFIFFTQNVQAIEPFVPFESNPLTLDESFSNRLQKGPMQSTIYHFGDEYQMWYTSFADNMRIMHAYSPNGYNWIADATYDFLEGIDIHDPYIVKSNTGFDLYFAASPAYEHTKIFKITSKNGREFDTSSLLTLITPGNSWDKNGASSPVLFFENDTYYLFYTGLSGSWSIGLATSQDGIHFNSCPQPFFGADVAPKGLIKINGKYTLFFHSSYGASYTQADSLSCNTSWSAKTVFFNTPHLHFVTQNEANIEGYYGTLINSVWKLNKIVSFNHIPTPTVQPTPYKTPIVIVPGLFASWNKQALLYNKLTEQADWTLNPWVKEYSGITKTLQNLGYIMNKDYFMFLYDWRKKVSENADYLSSYLEKLSLSNPPILIGHSLGGLVARLYAQKFDINNINKIITLGTPHKGTALSYKPLEAGELETDDPFLWIGQKIIINLNKKNFSSDKEILQTMMPSLYDLFPVYPFLKKNNAEIPVNQLVISNPTLLNISSINNLITMTGNFGPTLYGYETTERTLYDKLFDLYPDGRPVEVIHKPGDLTVPTISTNYPEAVDHILELNHGELIYSKKGISSLLSNLGIQYDENHIFEGQKTTIFPSLFFMMLSPAEFEIKYLDTIYKETDGILFIENAKSGNYAITIRGLEKGDYSFIIGQNGIAGSSWQTITGATNVNQIDKYSLIFDQGKPFEQSIGGLTELQTLFKNNHISFSRDKISSTYEQIFKMIRKENDMYKISNLLNILEKVELYLGNNVSFKKRISFNKNVSIFLFNKRVESAEKKLYREKINGKNIKKKLLLYQAVKNKINLIQHIYAGQTNYKVILFNSIQELLQII